MIKLLPAGKFTSRYDIWEEPIRRPPGPTIFLAIPEPDVARYIDKVLEVSEQFLSVGVRLVGNLAGGKRKVAFHISRKPWAYRGLKLTMGNNTLWLPSSKGPTRDASVAPLVDLDGILTLVALANEKS